MIIQPDFRAHRSSTGVKNIDYNMTSVAAMSSRPGKILIHEPRHGKTNKMACAPSEDSDQPGHDLSLSWAHMSFCWFCHDAAHIRGPLRRTKRKCL